MNLKPLNQKTLSSLLPIILVAVFLFVVPNFAYAIDCGFDAICWGTWVGGYIWGILFQIVQGILIFFLYIAGFILDNLLIYNVILNPNNMAAVKQGWQVLRDIANGLFLLILLWIAIKIIWSFDEAGSRKFLVRLIIMAFLINFSLAITGAVFGFANALAKPFRDKMGPDIAGYIVSKARLHTVQQTPTQEALNGQNNAFNSNPGDCGFSSLLDVGSPLRVGCALGTTVNYIADGFAGYAGKLLTNGGTVFAMQSGVGVVFLFLTIITFGGAIGFLILRIVMMVFLGVLAPAAFFLYAFPGKQGQALYDRWQRNLIGWAFIAPTFYFLFYVSLLILGEMTKSEIMVGTTFAANIFAFLPLIVFLVFMWTSLFVCKKLGAEVANTVIGAGQKIAGLAVAAGIGVATGGASLAAAGAIGGAAKMMTGASTAMGGVERIAQVPILGKLTKPLTNVVANRYRAKNEKINKISDSYKNHASHDIAREINTSVSYDKKAGLYEVLRKRGDHDLVDPVTQTKIGDYSNRWGREDYLKARPDQATKDTVAGSSSDKDARKRIFNRMTPEEKAQTSKHALTDPETKMSLLESSTVEDIKAMFKLNADMMSNLFYGMRDQNGQLVRSFFAQNKQELERSMRPETLQFIYSMPMIQRILQAQQQTPTPPPTPPPTTP